MKQYLLAVAAVLAALVFTGCSTQYLGTGLYQNQAQGRGDYVCIYQDLIFINVKAPSNIPSAENYWTWAGKYSLEKDGKLSFDMDTETRKKWDFSYGFLSRRGGIIVQDYETNTSFVLHYNVPKLRPVQQEQLPNAMPMGAEQEFAPMSNN